MTRRNKKDPRIEQAELAFDEFCRKTDIEPPKTLPAKRTQQVYRGWFVTGYLYAKAREAQKREPEKTDG